MKKIIDRIVLGSGSPNKNDLWIDDRDGLFLKVHDDGEWKPIVASKSSDSSFSVESLFAGGKILGFMIHYPTQYTYDSTSHICTITEDIISSEDIISYIINNYPPFVPVYLMPVYQYDENSIPFEENYSKTGPVINGIESFTATYCFDESYPELNGLIETREYKYYGTFTKAMKGDDIYMIVNILE